MQPEVTRLFAYDEMYLDVFQNDEFTIKRFNRVKIAISKLAVRCGKNVR